METMEQKLLRAQNEKLDVMVKITDPSATGDHTWLRLANVTYDQTTGVLSGVIEGEPADRVFSIPAEYIEDEVVQEPEDDGKQE